MSLYFQEHFKQELEVIRDNSDITDCENQLIVVGLKDTVENFRGMLARALIKAGELEDPCKVVVVDSQPVFQFTTASGAPLSLLKQLSFAREETFLLEYARI